MTIPLTLADLANPATLEALDVVDGLLPPAPTTPKQPEPTLVRDPVSPELSYGDYVFRQMPTAFSWTVSLWCAAVLVALVVIFLIGFWHGLAQAWDAGSTAVNTLSHHRAAGMPSSSLLSPGQ